VKYLVSWAYRLNGSADENDETLRRGLAVFSEWAPPQGSTYTWFVGRVDGRGGFALVETDDPADLADTTSKFGFIADYQISPVIDIARSAQSLARGVEFRASIS
jgi:hypothetical protein